MKLTPAEMIHRDLLERWRKAMNLVGPGPIAHHFRDSVQAIADLEFTGRWADLGSGAGFPGISLAVRHPNAQVVLVESRQKRATFLRRVIHDAAIANATVFHGRVEDLQPAFDGLISRAYKAPVGFLADAARLLVPEGRVVVLTADALNADALNADALNTPPAWRVLESRRYPVNDGERVRTVVRKLA